MQLQWLVSAFRAPDFPDADLTRRARLLNEILLLTIGLPPVLIAANLTFGTTPPYIANLRLAGLALAAMLCRKLLQRGRYGLASGGILVSLFLFAVAASAAAGTVRPLAAVLLLFDVVLAGLLLGERELAAAALASSAAYAGLVQAELAGRLPRPEIRPNLSQAAGFASLCAAVALVTYRGLRTVRSSLRHAQDEVQERRRVEAELEQRDAERRRSEERYRLISEVISDYTFSTQVDASGRLRLEWVAGAFEAITGYEYEEYVARGGWVTALHPEDRERDAQDLLSVRANRPVVSEVRTITKGGATRWVRVYAHPVWDSTTDRLIGIYGAVQDITERRVAEAEREALIRELEAKNRELENFTYAASHDLRSPLITISTFLGFLEGHARAGDYPALESDIDRIRAATEKMERLLRELLELSRIGRVVNTPGPVSLAELVREAESLTQGRLARHHVRLSAAEDLPVVFGDRQRLLQVLQNLLDNAAKFMGDQAEPRIVIAAHTDAREHRVLVTDNGIGISEKLQAKVFGLFEKLDPRAEGMGVGLALVKRIVESHGGRVFVESAGPGQGSTFGFALPRAEGSRQ